ncbi:MAG: hypothetical protein GY714_23465 [Desulfobacterales bacterium]|nr:hypothetical protein [Desulfobacterales bacterium]
MSENVLDECSFIYYNDCIKELQYKLQYDSMVFILGNNNCDVNEHLKDIFDKNPFVINIDQINSSNKLTLEDIQKAGFNIKKLNNVKLIKDMDKEDIQQKIEK